MKTLQLMVRIEIGESGYVSVNKAFPESELSKEYESYVDSATSIGVPHESKEGFELGFMKLYISYDGRKRKVFQEDVCKNLVKLGYAKHVTSNFYVPTEHLNELLERRLEERKSLMGIAS